MNRSRRVGGLICDAAPLVSHTREQPGPGTPCRVPAFARLAAGRGTCNSSAVRIHTHTLRQSSAADWASTGNLDEKFRSASIYYDLVVLAGQSIALHPTVSRFQQGETFQEVLKPRAEGVYSHPLRLASREVTCTSL